MTENKKDKQRTAENEPGVSNAVKKTSELNLDDTLSTMVQELSKKILEDINKLDGNKCLDLLLKLLERSGKMNRDKDSGNETSVFSSVTDEELRNLVANIVSQFGWEGKKDE